MSKPCPFCDRTALEPRVFFESKQWCAFLAAPFMTRGHAIAAAKPRSGVCPTAIDRDVLTGVDEAIVVVSDALKAHFQPKDVLFSSLRGDVKHFHIHLVPLWPEAEREWRKNLLYEKGHLHEFLGHVEKTNFAKALAERTEHGWDEEQQRTVLVKKLSPDVERLRQIAGYTSA